ncbi:MAG: 6-phosphogluconolactonase [Gammaproteobacteria bacterium]
MENISQTILNELEKDLCENALSTFIVSGGSSPVQIFKDLSAMDAKWSDINISLVDDRVVDVNHEDSNEKLVKELLIKDKAKDASFISICNQSNDLLTLKRPFNVMLLGMGEDGHFASLFPKLIETNPEYFDLESDAEIFFTEPMGDPCHKRVSMNLSMILESKNIFLLVSSEKKLQVLNQAKSDKSLPLYYLLNQDKADIKIIKHF